MSKRRNFYISSALAIVGIVLLSVDKLFVSADADITFAKSFTVLTIVGLILLMIAAIWFYKMTMD